MIARVVVENGPDRAFDYEIPAALASRIAPGTRVTIPFGRRRAWGTVTAVCDRSDWPHLKSVLAVGETRVELSPALLRLADWMAAYYGAPLANVLRTLMPASVRKESDAGGGPRRLYVTPVDGAAAPQGARYARRAAVLEAIRARGGGWMTELCRTLRVTPALLRALCADGALEIAEKPYLVGDLAADAPAQWVPPAAPVTLMPDQTAALAAVCAACDAADPRPRLLFGVTGSGKTEIYLRAIARLLDAGRGAIVMVPEIALTPQTTQRFRERFGAGVAVLHSAMGDAERRTAWQRVSSGEARVVVGPRSAVFAPVRQLGLIVVDEEHEPGYKQDEAPRYHARDVAVLRARLEPCAVLLGSATPSLESWRHARTGKYGLLQLPARVDHRRMPAIQIVDLRRETSSHGRQPVFSSALVEAVERRLALGEQTLLFLNRRGFAASMLCTRCGYVETCTHCSVARTYHRDAAQLRCHFCGDVRPVPAACPACGDPGFRYAGFGTQRIESIARKFFSAARIQRMDADTTTRKGSHERILTDFRARRTDILIGTQMIAKGLDFPNVTLVGILMADMSLHFPDFRAGERTYQLLAQVAGRSGRGTVSGQVIIQTCTPGHPAIQAVVRNDYAGFAGREMRERESLDYPPFRRLICVQIRGRDEAAVAAHARRLRAALAARLPAGYRVSEAVPAPLARLRGQDRYQILLRVPGARNMTAAIMTVLRDVPPPPAIHVAPDVDAIHLM